jgi:hypothetical protein
MGQRSSGIDRVQRWEAWEAAVDADIGREDPLVVNTPDASYEFICRTL